LISGAETVWGLVRAVLVGVLLVILIVRLFEDKFVFFPNLYSSNNWDTTDTGVPVEDVWLTTRDGVRLHGWYSAGMGASHTILFFHGNAGNVSDRLPTVGFLRLLPANVLAVDYRGYGKSDGKPTEAGVYLDAEAAYDYLVSERKVPPGEIVALGNSLGTAVAVDLATKRPLAGLILEGGFPSARRVARTTPLLPGIHLIIRSKYDSAEKLKGQRVPVLVAHCRHDPVLGFKLGEELFAAANEPKTFVAYDGDCHEPLFLADPQDYADRLRDFLRLATKAQK